MVAPPLASSASLAAFREGPGGKNLFSPEENGSSGRDEGDERSVGGRAAEIGRGPAGEGGGGEKEPHSEANEREKAPNSFPCFFHIIRWKWSLPQNGGNFYCRVKADSGEEAGGVDGDEDVRKPVAPPHPRAAAGGHFRAGAEVIRAGCGKFYDTTFGAGRRDAQKRKEEGEGARETFLAREEAHIRIVDVG